jgi:ring-1,2-phenylacetyl-CoA epoxidase subunit PaaC
MNPSLIKFILQLADNSLIHGHRLSEWCGHGPILEVDIALSNIALDQIGAARSFYQYAAVLEGNNKTEDTYPYHRDVRSFYNVLLLELPKGNFGDTITQSFFFDAFQFEFYHALSKSSDQQLAAIAEKSLKEVTYHLRFSSEWLVRLGDGTKESHDKIQQSIYTYWDYCGELFDMSDAEKELLATGVSVHTPALKSQWEKRVADTLHEATLAYPLSKENAWFHKGGKNGIHTEHLGFLLAEMQYLQKSYPGAEW